MRQTLRERIHESKVSGVFSLNFHPVGRDLHSVLTQGLQLCVYVCMCEWGLWTESPTLFLGSGQIL